MSAQGCCSGKTSTRKGSKTGCCSATDKPKFRTVGGSRGCNCSTDTPAPVVEERSCGCNGELGDWVTGSIKTPVGEVPQVATRLSLQDVLGSWKCRWNIGRMDYIVSPGLYAIGHPDARSQVLVTANYKMTFDRVRKELDGLNLWIVVLDTDGINVWCAAGKGTFGTEELVHRLAAVGLKQIVSHRSIILPQLGAAGVAAHEVAAQSGFHVVYGPVRAEDIKPFIAADGKATPLMRTVRFTLWDRMVLVPMELLPALRMLIVVFGVLFLLNAIGLGQYGTVDLVATLGAVLTGAVLTPLLLPWIPGRAFAFKGFLLGLLWALVLNWSFAFPVPQYGWWKTAAMLLILPALSAFWAMNFTGSSTYTSLSGVDREMRFALPAMIGAAAIGGLLLLVNDFVRVFSS